MKTSVEPLEGNKVKLSVEVEEQEFESRIDATLRRIAREVRIPGFRPGKAPRRILEARMGKASVRQEAMRDALPELYAQAIRDNEIDAIAAPEIDITAGEEGGPLQFDAVVEVRPQLQLAGYQGLRITVPRPDVTAEELQRHIDRLRQSSGELRTVTRPAQDGDHVTVDIGATKDGEPFDPLTATDFLYEVGSGGIFPEVDDNLRGANAGETLTFDAKAGDDTFAFTATVKEIKEMVLPEVTDEWASEASEFETVAELEDDLRQRLSEVKKMQVNLAVREETVKALVELVDEEAPESLVQAEVERRLHDLAHRLERQGATLADYLMATGQQEQQLLDELRAGATESVKADLALRAVADGEGIEVAEEDVDEEIVKLATQMQTDAATVRRQLERSDQMPAVRSDIRKAKALGWLVDHVEIVDDEGKPIDRADLEPARPDPGTPGAGEETEDA
jgi:trigger factor